MKKPIRGAKAAKRASLILLLIACAILGFALTNQILKGGTLDSTKIGATIVGVICFLFAIFYYKLHKKKRNEENR
jgi:hypothetical protein